MEFLSQLQKHENGERVKSNQELISKLEEELKNLRKMAYEALQADKKSLSLHMFLPETIISRFAKAAALGNLKTTADFSKVIPAKDGFYWKASYVASFEEPLLEALLAAVLEFRNPAQIDSVQGNHSPNRSLVGFLSSPLRP